MVSPSYDLTPDALRSAFAKFPSGIAAVAAMDGGTPVGLAASSFTSVSLRPALASVCIARTSTTWPQLRLAPHIGLSVLAEQHGRVARALAAKGIDRFADFRWERTDDGAVFVHDSCLWLDTHLEREIPAGDHDIVLLRIEAVWTYPDVAPLVFYGSGFRGLREASGHA
ncbi:MAG TPA: flavin reductase family protein [Pseudonocardiaceae bacterium]|nr:flavin reductase family protein [Pseudonocardiaceae bacterium]